MPKRLLVKLLFLLLCCASAPYALEGNKRVSAALISRTKILQPSNTEHILAVSFEIEEGWHMYWVNSGEAAIPTSVKWKLPDSWERSDNIWPLPYRFKEAGDITTYGYKDKGAVFLKVRPPLGASGEVVIETDVKWLVCKETCVPGKTQLKETFLLSNDAPEELSKEWSKVSELYELTPALSAPELSAKASLAQDGTGRIEFTHPRFDKDSVQIFPYSNTNVEFESPVLTKTSLVLPYKSSVTNEVLVSGVFALGDSNLPWQTAIDPGNTSSNLEPLQISGIPTHRFVDLDAVDLVEEPLKQELSTAAMVIYAVLAGIILNFMPCVLPVVSIKVFSIVESSKKCSLTARKSVLFYSLGIISSMLVLAGAVISLKGVGSSAGWGFQFQSPGYVVSLIIVIFLLALSFFNFYQFKFAALTKACSIDTEKKHYLVKDFLDGVLTTALSTPCSAPFLGVVVAFALRESAAAIVAVFALIGVGLSIPYALVALSPKLAAVLPKPGNWMLVFKKILGYLLLATCIWLTYVLVSLVGGHAAVYLLGVLLFFAFSIWAAGLTSSHIFAGLLLILNAYLLVNYWPIFTDTSRRQATEIASDKINWVAFDTSYLTNRTSQSPAVFIEFTADWCITCKATEKAVIETDEIAVAMLENNVLAVKADWTTGDEEITLALESFGAAGVPLYVYYPPGSSKPEILPVLLTKSRLLSTLNS